MAIIDEQVYKLNFYDNRVCNALYACEKSAENCKKMIKKLVFYDRDAILEMHAKCLEKRAGNYDLSMVEPISFLKKDEEICGVVPLDKNWLGIMICDKKSKEIKKDRVMYISYEGDGYLCDDIEPLKNGYVPDYCYYKFRKDMPVYMMLLDEKYYDGNHNDFLNNLNEIVANEILRICSEILKVDNLSLDQVIEIYHNAFKKENRENPEYDTARDLDIVFMLFNVEEIRDLQKTYNKNKEKENF